MVRAILDGYGLKDGGADSIPGNWFSRGDLHIRGFPRPRGKPGPDNIVYGSSRGVAQDADGQLVNEDLSLGRNGFKIWCLNLLQDVENPGHHLRVLHARGSGHGSKLIRPKFVQMHHTITHLEIFRRARGAMLGARLLAVSGVHDAGAWRCRRQHDQSLGGPVCDAVRGHVWSLHCRGHQACGFHGRLCRGRQGNRRLRGRGRRGRRSGRRNRR
mmetsp:Transcript_15190/g.44980  ORF Transcript_15190/g.44980 Transcript_15190/m.44980 type:complete len:214 (-) Transcript_15190:244-885(-)